VEIVRQNFAGNISVDPDDPGLEKLEVGQSRLLFKARSSFELRMSGA